MWHGPAHPTPRSRPPLPLPPYALCRRFPCAPDVGAVPACPAVAPPRLAGLPRLRRCPAAPPPHHGTDRRTELLRRGAGVGAGPKSAVELAAPADVQPIADIRRRGGRARGGDVREGPAPSRGGRRDGPHLCSPPPSPGHPAVHGPGHLPPPTLLNSRKVVLNVCT